NSAASCQSKHILLHMVKIKICLIHLCENGFHKAHTCHKCNLMNFDGIAGSFTP
ncbi:hypothetical protein IRJ41_004117, partial [Triplophysa rosa]